MRLVSLGTHVASERATNCVMHSRVSISSNLQSSRNALSGIDRFCGNTARSRYRSRSAGSSASMLTSTARSRSGRRKLSNCFLDAISSFKQDWQLWVIQYRHLSFTAKFVVDKLCGGFTNRITQFVIVDQPGNISVLKVIIPRYDFDPF